MEVTSFWSHKWLVRGGLILATLLLFSTNLPLRAEIRAIRLYQKVGSPVMRYMVTCRYEPTCSHFALRALDESGFWIGNLRIAQRLSLCSPLGFLLDPGKDRQVTNQ